MRSTLDVLSFRVTVLGLGLSLVAAACTSDGGPGGFGGAGGSNGTGGVTAGSGGKTDAGTGMGGMTTTGAGGRVDGGSAGTGAGGSAGAGAGGRVDGGTAGTTGVAGMGAGGSAGTGAGGSAGTGAGGSAFSLPWHAFLPLAAPGPGSGTASGTLTDLTTNHYDGTYFGPTIRFMNNALNLTGVGSEFVVVPDKAGVPAVDVAGSYSVSAWVTLTNLANYRTVVGGEGVNISSFFLQKRGDTGAFAFTVPASDAIAAFGCIAPGPAVDGGPPQNPVIPVVNVQYHLVATRDATTGVHILYVNGVESGRNTCATAGWADTGILGIGHGIFASNRVDNVQGSIAEVGVINRTLTAGEVSDLYARGRIGMPPPDAGTDTGTDAPVDAPTDTPAPTDGGATDGGATDASDGG